MNVIDLPYHLIIPSITAISIVCVIVFYREKLFKKGKFKIFWIMTTLFIGIYLLIVGYAAFTDISLQVQLQRLDLNGDGFFNGEELTPEVRRLLRKSISDIGRNFSFITGLIFSAFTTFVAFLSLKIVRVITKKLYQTKDCRFN